MTPNLRKLLGVSFVSTLGWFAFASFLAPYLRSAGVAVVTVGLFYSLNSAFEAPSSFVGGILADRVGRRPVLIAGRALRTLGWLVVVLAPTMPGLVAGAILLGLAGIAGSAYRALIAESATPGRRATAFAVVGVVENTVGTLMPALVGLLATSLGLRPVMITAAVVSAVGVAVLVSRMSETAAGPVVAAPAEPAAASPATETPVASGRASALDGLRFMATGEGSGAVLMTAIWLVTGFGMGLLAPVWGLYVTDRFGVSYAGLGAVSMGMGLGAALGQAAGGFLADRVGHSRLMIGSLCITVPAWFSVTLAGRPWEFSLLTMITYLLAYVSASCWEAVGANAVPRRMRGVVTGVYGAVAAVGAMLGGAFGGLAYSKSILLPWYLMAAGDLIMLILIVVGQRAALRGFAAAPTSAAAD